MAESVFNFQLYKLQSKDLYLAGKLTEHVDFLNNKFVKAAEGSKDLLDYPASLIIAGRYMMEYGRYTVGEVHLRKAVAFFEDKKEVLSDGSVDKLRLLKL